MEAEGWPLVDSEDPGFVELRACLGWLTVENWKSRLGADLSTPTVSGEIYLQY